MINAKKMDLKHDLIVIKLHSFHWNLANIHGKLMNKF